MRLAQRGETWCSYRDDKRRIKVTETNTAWVKGIMRVAKQRPQPVTLNADEFYRHYHL